MKQIDVLLQIKSLQNSDKRRVEKAYYALFKEASPYRYRNIVSIGSQEFDSLERAALSNLFIEINGKWQLNASPEFFELIGEEIPMTVQ